MASAAQPWVTPVDSSEACKGRATSSWYQPGRNVREDRPLAKS